MTDAALEPHFLRPDLLAERLAEWIRDEIVSGRMAPGERLVEQALAKRCKVSRVPLREALRIVASEGLLILAPHRGAMVTPLSEDELSELFDLRMALEGFAAAAVSRLEPAQDLSSLQVMNEQMEGFVKSQDYESYHRLAAGFHAALVAAARNQLLIETYDRIKVRFRRYQAALSKIPELPQHSVIEHKEILEAMEQRNPELARTLAENHVRRLVSQYREYKVV